MRCGCETAVARVTQLPETAGAAARLAPRPRVAVHYRLFGSATIGWHIDLEIRLVADDLYPRAGGTGRRVRRCIRLDVDLRRTRHVDGWSGLRIMRIRGRAHRWRVVARRTVGVRADAADFVGYPVILVSYRLMSRPSGRNQCDISPSEAPQLQASYPIQAADPPQAPGHRGVWRTPI